MREGINDAQEGGEGQTLWKKMKTMDDLKIL